MNLRKLNNILTAILIFYVFLAIALYCFNLNSFAGETKTKAEKKIERRLLDKYKKKYGKKYKVKFINESQMYNLVEKRQGKYCYIARVVARLNDTNSGGCITEGGDYVWVNDYELADTAEQGDLYALYYVYTPETNYIEYKENVSVSITEQKIKEYDSQIKSKYKKKYKKKNVVFFDYNNISMEKLTMRKGKNTLYILKLQSYVENPKKGFSYTKYDNFIRIRKKGLKEFDCFINYYVYNPKSNVFDDIIKEEHKYLYNSGGFH